MPATRRLAVTRPARQPAAAVDEFHVVRAEIEGCGARPVRSRHEGDRAVLMPDFAIGEGDVEAGGLADEALDEGRDRMHRSRRGVPTCSIAPLLITTTRSASSSASSCP